jgi:phosphatidylethanolamine/phosphatidyl-N-methylethanolamine N-methyltransferase
MFVHRFRDSAIAEARRFRASCGDDIRFLRSWASRPLTTGAISPSGRALAEAMAAGVDPEGNGTVVELGPGTGSVTAALLRRGIAPERIVAIEFNAEFVEPLRRRFPAVRVVEGDAYALRETLSRHGIRDIGAVVSSLPLFTRPPAVRRRLVGHAMAMMPPESPFVQFSYALVPPVRAAEGRWTLDVSDWVLMNLPPARVWTYRKV